MAAKATAKAEPPPVAALDAAQLRQLIAEVVDERISRLDFDMVMEQRRSCRLDRERNFGGMDGYYILNPIAIRYQR